MDRASRVFARVSHDERAMMARQGGSNGTAILGRPLGDWRDLRRLALAVPIVLSACAAAHDPAVAVCDPERRVAITPATSVSIGLGGGGGLRTGVSVGVSGNPFPGRRDAAYEACLLRRAGLRVVPADPAPAR